MQNSTYGDGIVREIVVGGQTHRFEYSDMFGPALVGEDDQQPDHRFQSAVMWWDIQGKRISDDGMCVWDDPIPEVC